MAHLLNVVPKTMMSNSFHTPSAIWIYANFTLTLIISN